MFAVMSAPEGYQQPGGSIITQVAANQGQGFLDPFSQGGLGYADILRLDLRGTVIELTRQELAQLPENILLGISNGLCTDAQGNILVSAGEVASVNFSPECLQYTLDKFREAAKELPTAPSSAPTTPTIDQEVDNVAELLRTKPAIIVLREDLDYYCLPPKAAISLEEMIAIKRECGKRLVGNNEIFTSLKRDDNAGAAEKHLIDMLCSSGFSIDERWGFRAMEPAKTVVSSLALVRLKPGEEEAASEDEEFEDANEILSSPINSPVSALQSDGSTPMTSTPTSPFLEDSKTPTSDHHENGESATQKNTSMFAETARIPISSSSSSSSTSSDPSDTVDEEESDHGGETANFEQHESDFVKSHKLLLFWRKPARKCWWDYVSFDDIPGVDGQVSVHVRSVWTLELSVIGHE